MSKCPCHSCYPCYPGYPCYPDYSGYPCYPCGCRKGSDEVVLWFGKDEYEGLAGGYRMAAGIIRDPDGDEVPHRPPQSQQRGVVTPVPLGCMQCWVELGPAERVAIGVPHGDVTKCPRPRWETPLGPDEKLLDCEAWEYFGEDADQPAKKVCYEIKAGDKVSAKFKGGGYYPGTVMVCNPDETFQIQYNDGDFDAKVSKRSVKPSQNDMQS